MVQPAVRLRLPRGGAAVRPDRGAARLRRRPSWRGVSPPSRTRSLVRRPCFSAARALLGVAESANFPGAIKAVAEWFPKNERALATGIFNAGTNTGAILTPLLVPGSRSSGVGSGPSSRPAPSGSSGCSSGSRYYRSPAVESARDERRAGAYPQATHPTPRNTRVSWIRLLWVQQTWAIAAGKFLADPIWWFYLYWLPKFLDSTYGIKLAQVALPSDRHLSGVPTSARSVGVAVERLDQARLDR